jgi:hypothetical protein
MSRSPSLINEVLFDKEKNHLLKKKKKQKFLSNVGAIQSSYLCRKCWAPIVGERKDNAKEN